MKKIRIIYSDPYATDSSSDDEDYQRKGERKPVKRFVYEINIEDKVEFKKSPKRKRTTLENPEKLGLNSRSLCKGVGLRKSDKWAAEIQNPFTEARIWLGTYGTPEESYCAKKLEFDEKAASGKAASDSIKEKRDVANPEKDASEEAAFETCEKEGAASSLVSSPWSVLENNERCSEISKEMASFIIDENGYLLGEYSKIDDMTTREWLIDNM